MANLIPYAMDASIYTQATIELHRRDDLLTLLNYNVGFNNMRDLRLSTFCQEKLFDPADLC